VVLNLAGSEEHGYISLARLYGRSREPCSKFIEWQVAIAYIVHIRYIDDQTERDKDRLNIRMGTADLLELPRVDRIAEIGEYSTAQRSTVQYTLP
jgi:hypothetical protein